MVKHTVGKEFEAQEIRIKLLRIRREKSDVGR